MSKKKPTIKEPATREPATPSASPPADGPPVFSFFTEVGIIDQLARTRFEQVMPGGLSMAQFTLLHHLARLGGEWNLVRLANAFQVSKPAITKVVSKLQGKKLVKVAPDPIDGRGKLVSLTAAGQKARDQAIGQLATTIAPFMAEFDDEMIQQALPFLQAVRKWLDEHRDS